ncbi:DUF6249 domain-containing protein [Thermophagus sp. OGC60D27]|uniref:DUF6249 domain-containing protein n=1 Tax=Thermophagus sp. OGC60D27 TaxID=3458415 RepID=UPI00403806B5
MDFIMIPLIVGMITLGIYKLFELFVRRKERLKIIDKMDGNFNAELWQKNYLSTVPHNHSYNTLKIACLLLGVGLGLLTGFYILGSWGNDILFNDSWQARETKSIVYGATVLLFGGLGLLIAFLLEQRNEKNKK